MTLCKKKKKCITVLSFPPFSSCTRSRNRSNKKMPVSFFSSRRGMSFIGRTRNEVVALGPPNNPQRSLYTDRTTRHKVYPNSHKTKMNNLDRRFSSVLQSRTTAGLSEIRLRIVERFGYTDGFPFIMPGSRSQARTRGLSPGIHKAKGEICGTLENS